VLKESGERSLWDKDWNMVVDVGANAGDSVRVAIINTGIDRSHPDLQDNIVGGAYVYYDPSSPGGASLIEADYDDTDGHGTKVAGVVCAVDKDPGAVGAAPHSGIFAIKLESSFFLHPEVDARY